MAKREHNPHVRRFCVHLKEWMSASGWSPHSLIHHLYGTAHKVAVTTLKEDRWYPAAPSFRSMSDLLEWTREEEDKFLLALIPGGVRNKGAWLKRERYRQGITLARLARVTSTDRRTWERYESTGRIPPGLLVPAPIIAVLFALCRPEEDKEIA